MDDNEWARKLVTTLNDSHNLFPDLLTALDQVRWEDDFMYPPTPYFRDDVEFTTQLSMYPEREFNPERWSWSLTYCVIWAVISGMNLCAA